MATTPNARAGSPQGEVLIPPHLTADSSTMPLHGDVIPEGEPRHTYRTLHACRIFLEAVDVFLVQRLPYATVSTRENITRMRAALQNHTLNLLAAAEHEATLDGLDAIHTAAKGGAA